VADGGTRALAARWFGVCPRTIGLIICRRRWAWLPDQTDYSLAVS
jgi:hypothetical protein